MTSSIRDPQVAEYIQRGTPHEQAIIQALIGIIFEAEPSMEEAIKWRRITYTVNGNWHHWICGIEITKKYVSLIFHKGALLNDPSRILQGEGRYLRQIKLTSPSDIDRPALIGVIRDAVAKQTAL